MVEIYFTSVIMLLANKYLNRSERILQSWILCFLRFGVYRSAIYSQQKVNVKIISDIQE